MSATASNLKAAPVMLCRRCERRAWNPRLLPLGASPERVWGAAAIGDVICVRCGGVLPPNLVTERLLRSLAQLDRFGLGAAGGPLLQPNGENP